MDKQQIVELIRQKALAAGLDPDMVVRVAELESSLRPQAKNPRSSAGGLFQLTNMRKRELGIPLKKQYSIEEQVDHGVQSLAQAQSYLEDRLDRKPQAYEVYAAHFSGPAGSVKVLSAPQEVRTEQVYSRKAMKSNPKLRGLTAGEIRQQWQDKFGDIGREPRKPDRPQRLTPQQMEQQVAPVQPEESVPNWEQIGQGQLTAQAELDQEPVMMAMGGEVQDDEDESPLNQKLARMVQMARTDEDFRRINELIAGPRPAGFAKGGEVDDEPTPEELEEASKPSFRTSSAGGGRKKGDVSKALESGTAAREMLKGATMLPQNILGAPVDVATMAMRPFGYSVEKPVMGSEWLKEKSRQAGVAYAPSGTQAERGFFTAGDVLSNLVNPAGATRTAVRGAQQTGQAARELAAVVEANARAQDPFFAGKAGGQRGAVRPVGSVMAVEPVGGIRSGVEKLLESGRESSRDALRKAFREKDYKTQTWTHEEGLHPPVKQEDLERKEEVIRNFWDTKAKNYFVKQFGTPNDPIAQGIAKQRIRSSVLEEQFPDYMLDPLYAGSTRTTPEGQQRFFPKYPKAWEDFTRRYDTATGLKGDVVLPGAQMGNPDYTYVMGPRGEAAFEQARRAEIERLLEQGVRPSEINVELGKAFRSGKEPERVVGDGTSRAAELFKAYEATPETLQAEYLTPLSETVTRAIEKGQPVYDIGYMHSPLKDLFDPGRINYYLASIPARQAANMRFEDVVKGAIEMHETKLSLSALDAQIRKGKAVPQKVFDEGISGPLLSFPKGSPFEGYAWKRIEDRKATVPEGAYIHHSVGGYELGGATYGMEKRNGFNTGEYQVYTLRDPRNKPVTTVEVKRLPSGDLEVLQIKGDGPATGNTAPEQHSDAVAAFLQNYLKPVYIKETDTYLTPQLQLLKQRINNPGSVPPAVTPAAVPAQAAPEVPPQVAAQPPQNVPQQDFDAQYQNALRLFGRRP